MNRKVKIETLGCRTNQYESQAYLNQFEELGYTSAKDGEQADICIVNTCTVTESADKRSVQQIKRLHRDHPDAKIYVTGCLAERNKAELHALPGVEKVVENGEKEALIHAVFPDAESLPEFQISRFEAHTRAFVKVQDGCNSFCSYCIIPYVRGRSRSKTVPQILDEVRELVANGYKEIVLTGINIGDFDGGDGSVRLHDLVWAVDAVEGVERIRISSIDPDEVDDALLDAVINAKKTCPSMHIVLQAGSNKILKKMNRKYTREEFFTACERLHAANPDFTFTTDIIVGFPGETEEDFQETLGAMRGIRFSKVHMFPFSVRPGTRAARMKEVVPNDVILKRKQQLLRESEKIGFALREEYIGKVLSVLIESDDPQREGYVTGHTENFLQVSVPKGNLRSNDIVDVELIENTESGLVGVVCQLALV